MGSCRHSIRIGLLLGLAAVIAALGSTMTAQTTDGGSAPSLVEVYWKSSGVVPLPGITNLIVLDPEISRAETGTDQIVFYGLERGETVALGYVNGKPVSMRVRVQGRPAVLIPPSLLRRQSEMAQGSISSTAQISNLGANNNIALLSGFSWSQAMGNDSRFDFSSQVEDNSFANGHAFNLRQATMLYHAPWADVRALDFPVDLT